MPKNTPPDRQKEETESKVKDAERVKSADKGHSMAFYTKEVGKKILGIKAKSDK